MATLFVGSIYLAEFTAVRYEQYDDKVTMMSEEEALKMDREKRKVDMKEEYYRLQQLGPQDDWEQVRVPRLKGESENVW